MYAVNINPGAPAGGADADRPWVANNGQGHVYAVESAAAVAAALTPEPPKEPENYPKTTTINCCGMAQLTGISGVRNGQCQKYITDPVTKKMSMVTLGVEEAIISALWIGGFIQQTYQNNNYSTPDPATWDNTVGQTAAIMWTDAEYVGAGQVLADFFIKKGYRVQCTDIGINPKYGTKEHFLRHWIAFTGPKGKIGQTEAETLSLTREYRYVDEQQKQQASPESITAKAPRNPDGYTAAGVRKFGRVAGAGVRAFRTGRPLRTSIR